MNFSERKIKSRIIFSDELPDEGSGTLIHYDHESILRDGWVTYDVRETVSLYEDEWLSAIGLWHRKLSENASKLTPWWWLNSGSRLVVWGSEVTFSLKPILFALAIIKLSSNSSSSSIWIVGAPDELIEYITEWINKENFFEVENKLQNTNTNVSNSWLLSSVFFYYKLIKQVIYFIMRTGFHRKKQIGTASVIVNSTVLDSNLIDTIGDHYFGRMLDGIKGVINTDVVWLYNDVVIDKIKTVSKLTALDKRALFVSDSFCWSDVWFALRNALKLHNCLKDLSINPPSLLIDGIEFKKFSIDYMNNFVLQYISFFEFIIYRQTKRILSETKASVLIYPYEEKTIERAMLMAAKEIPHYVKTIGFAHAAYSKGHMYIKQDSMGEPPRPEFIAVTGDMSRKRFENAGVLRSKLIITGSPRYHSRVNEYKNNLVSRRKKLLFIVGLGFEMRIFSEIICSSPSILDEYELYIRRSYHSWFKEQDAAEERMQAAGIAYTCVNGDLATQIDKSDIVVFESTSAGLESSLRGKLVIRLNLSDIIKTKHFIGKSFDKDVKYCHNAKDFMKELKRLSSLSHDELNEIANQQRELARSVFSPIDESAIENLIINDTSSCQ